MRILTIAIVALLTIGFAARAARAKGAAMLQTRHDGSVMVKGTVTAGAPYDVCLLDLKGGRLWTCKGRSETGGISMVIPVSAIGAARGAWIVSLSVDGVTRTSTLLNPAR